MARSLNKVQLIGNLTRDPELRYTPTGAAVCTFGLATNRNWTVDSGEKKEEVEFHRIVAWNKLGELCSQLLAKGRKVYLEGRIAYRKYTDKNGVEQNVTEIVVDDMLVLDSKFANTDRPTDTEGAEKTQRAQKVSEDTQSHPVEDVQEPTMSGDEVADDIPF